jgi:lipopolysaccharide transport system permease protein
MNQVAEDVFAAATIAQTGRADAEAAGHGADRVVLQAGRTAGNYWRDLWRYRELFAILAWRDLVVRYKQTAIGVAWALIRPLMTVAIFTIVFGRVAKLPSDGHAPYALMVFAGMLPWTLISNVLGESAASLVNNSNLIAKIYFPRLIVPGAKIVVTLTDAVISLFLLILMMVWFDYLPGWRTLLLPAFILLAVFTSLGPGLWLAAMNVKYRDFQYIVGFALQLGLYISPVGFSSSAIPDQWRLIYSLNPAVGVIDGFRWSLLGGDVPLYAPALLWSVCVTLLMLWAGIAAFRRAELGFADQI